MNATDPPQPRRILLVRPSALGDVCRTVPVLASLRQAFPDAGIDWVVQDTFVDAVRAHPAVDEVIPFPRRRLAGWWRSPRVAREAVRWFADLRRRRYDVVYDLQGLGRSGLMAFASGAPRRVGFRSAREFAWLGYTARHAPPHAEHVVDQMLELLEREQHFTDTPRHKDDLRRVYLLLAGAARPLDVQGEAAGTSRQEATETLAKEVLPGLVNYRQLKNMI